MTKKYLKVTLRKAYRRGLERGVMKASTKIVTLAALLTIFMYVCPCFAEVRAFEREYVYKAGEADSKLTCRAIGLEQVKRLLLEELGTYLESITEVKDFQLTKDQITSLTAGVVQTQIIDEKWDGQHYKIRALIKADPKEVATTINKMKDNRKKISELEDAKRRADNAMEEIQKLRAELEAIKARPDSEKTARYYNAVKELNATDWFQRASYFVDNQMPKEALEAFNKVIELDPKYAQAYNGRGFMNMILGNLKGSIYDYTKSIEIDPSNAEPYNNRAIIFEILQDQDKAFKDYSRAIELNPKTPAYYRNRANLHFKAGRIGESINDYSRAIELDPKDYESYYYRGNNFLNLKNYIEAIKNYEKALQIKPDYAVALFNLACVNSLTGDTRSALYHLEKSIKINPEFKNSARQDRDFDPIRHLPEFKRLVY